MNTQSAIFWTILSGAVLWLVLLFVTFRNIATRTDLSMTRKAVWIIVIFMAPVIGLIIYLAVGKRSVKRS